MACGTFDAILQDPRPVALAFRSPIFNPSEGFIQTQMAGLERYQPLVAGLEDKGHVIPELAGRILLARGPAQAFAFRGLAMVGPLLDRIRPFSPVLLHAHFGTDGLLALPLARALEIPLVTTLRGYEISRARGRMLTSGRLSWVRYALARQRLMNAGALFLTVSDALRDKAIAQGYPAERTHTHYSGVDLERFRPGESAPEPGLILHVGRLVEKKGTSVLISAFAALAEAVPEARLAIVGDGPRRAKLERQCATLGLGARVHFHGARTRDQVAALMRRAWLLAVPSVTARDGDSEGLPTALVEAAACGLPAVGTRHSGIPEAILDGQSGFIVPERDVEALATALLSILGDADLRRRMGQCARSLAEQKFDASRQNRLLEDRYDSARRATALTARQL